MNIFWQNGYRVPMSPYLNRFRQGVACWYIEALCQGLMIGFSEVLIIIWYSRQISDAVVLGVILTVPAAIGAVTQAIATRHKDRLGGVRRLAIGAIATQTLGLAVMAFGLQNNASASGSLFLGQCLYWMGGMTAMSPTQELLAHMVPPGQHNRFFSRRAMIITLLTLVCNVYSASRMDDIRHASWMIQLLVIATLARALSLGLIILNKPNSASSPHAAPHSQNAQIQVPSILNLSLCIMVFRCAVNISSPFYSAYMLNELGLSVTVYSLLTAIPLVTKTLCLNNWAKLLDDNRKFEGLVLATILIGTVPIMWSIGHSLPWLGSLQMLSGISWSGFDLISVLLIQHMFPRSITRNLGLFMALGSLGSVAGGAIGGAIVNHFASYRILFAVSGVARLLTGFFLLWYLRRNHLFRFHRLNLKHGLATLVTVKPSIEAAAKLIPLPSRRGEKRDDAA